MSLRAFLFASCLALAAAPAWAEGNQAATSVTAAATAAGGTSVTAAAAAPAEEPAAAAAGQPLPAQAGDRGMRGLSLGLGWPELRARYGFGFPVDAEIKAAFGDGIQVYGARAYWSPYRRGRLGLLLGAEAGLASFAAAFGADGSGWHLQPFAGVSTGLTSRLSWSAELGPAFVRASSPSAMVEGWEWIFSTAFYLRVF